MHGAAAGRTGEATASMAAVQAPELLFAGRLLHVKYDTAEIQIEKEAITFLQKLAEPITVVSVHGAKESGKTTCVHDLVVRENPNAEPTAAAVSDKELPAVQDATGVWLYVKKANYSNVKYIAFVDLPGFGANQKVEQLLYSILVGLSSVVIHHTRGLLTPDSVGDFTFLATAESAEAAKSLYVFPHGPKLVWLLQDVSSGQLKECVAEKNLSAQEMEHLYLRDTMASLPLEHGAFVEQFRTAFPEQVCFPIPKSETSAYDKRVDKLLRLLMESGRNRYLKGVHLNGPLFGSMLVSMLAHRDNIYQAFRGRIWKDVIHNCCLNIVESGIKLYKSRMAEQLGGIVDTSDLHDYTPLFPSKEPLSKIDLPAENDVLERIHHEAKRTAKMNLRTMPVRSGKLSALLQKLFKDLVDSLYTSIREENNRLSSELCRNLLKELHGEMTAKVLYLLEIPPHQKDEGYAVQSMDFKRFFHLYQEYLFDLMGEYTERARGPVKKQELSEFCNSTIRLQLKELSVELEKIRERDVTMLEDEVKDLEQKVEDANENQKQFQKEAMNAQTEVNKELVDVARLQALRKEALEGAIDDLDNMHALATKQKELLEEAAFVSVQVPSQKVMEAAEEAKKSQLQGYLIKQGGGGNAFNPLGRRNWKQRYFILNGDSLIYAKTKDDFERGRIIKELHLSGCRVEPSRDAGEGFEIVPPKSGKTSHVFELQRGLFDKNSRKKSSYGDNGRVFKLRAQSIEERDKWIKMLRVSAGGYKQ